MRKLSLLISFLVVATLGCGDAPSVERLTLKPPLYSSSYGPENDMDGESEWEAPSKNEEPVLLDSSRLAELQEAKIEDFSQQAHEVSNSISPTTIDCEFGPSGTALP